MELTRKGEYAIRGILYLAQQPPGKVSLLSDIADATDAPQTFLAKIFQSFAKLGIVNSYRGTGGGFVLALGLRLRRSCCLATRHIDQVRGTWRAERLFDRPALQVPRRLPTISSLRRWGLELREIRAPLAQLLRVHRAPFRVRAR